MTLRLDGRMLRAGEHVVFDELPPELAFVGDRSKRGALLSLTARETATRFRIRLGKVPLLERYVVCHRDEPYWMKPAVGHDLAEVPAETQFLLARLRGLGWLLMVPLVDEPLRFSLQGSKQGVLEMLAETGDAKLPASEGTALYLALGDDPFLMMPECAAEVAEHLGSGKLRREKPLPEFVDQFGWCTWDAFYADVSADKVREGLERFRDGGVSPKMMILDDGWLDTERRPTGEKRLTSFAANAKFPQGLAPLVSMAKGEFGIETLLVWHTIVGYWGGIDPSLGYGAVDQVRHFGEGILTHMPRVNNEWWGELVGYVPTEHIARFFDDFHRELRAQGVDGVKVDSQALLEGLSQGEGGRVAVSRAYRRGLEDSVKRHFDGRLINCMSNAQETWYFSPSSTLIRSSIDFFPKAPDSHGLHLYTNALVGLWFGEFMHPDWDMFQSGHAMGAFHAAGRAISGGPVYVSDKPGEHDFELLKKLVCSDGRVLRCKSPGLPTLDCLLSDPARERVLLKVWNRHERGGIVGAFNCYYDVASGAGARVAGAVSPGDIPGLEAERLCVFAHGAQRHRIMQADDSWSVELAAGEFELFTVVPVQDGFAAVGLSDKFNSRAAVVGEQLAPDRAALELMEGGVFVAYSERVPRALVANGKAVRFEHDAVTSLLRAELPRGGSLGLVIEW